MVTEPDAAKSAGSDSGKSSSPAPDAKNPPTESAALTPRSSDVVAPKPAAPDAPKNDSPSPAPAQPAATPAPSNPTPSTPDAAPVSTAVSGTEQSVAPVASPPVPATGDVVQHDPHHDPHHDISGDPYHDHDPYHQHYHDYDPHAHDHHHESDPYHQQHHHDDFHRDAYVPPPPSGTESSAGDHDEDEEGGPVKPFLDHLEDLRWMLIKCVVVTIIGMVICLAGGNVLMEALMWPLDRSALQEEQKTTNQVLIVAVGTNVLGRLSPPAGSNVLFDLGKEKRAVFELVPLRVGTNEFLAFSRSTNNPAALKPPRKKLLNLTPAGGFMVAFQLAIYGGIVLASPFLIYFIGQFLLPALKLKEKHYLLRGFGIGVFLFLGGVAFCYFALMPVALSASAAYSNWLGIEADQWTAENYISFVCKFMLGMGLGFEMPVILLILVKIGVLNYRMLAGFRRYMIVINLVLGAVLTTPEVLTQVMMAIPLQLLYEITIWIAWYWEWRERKREEKAAAAAAAK
jgi:sec-independent protein translocase protein TatC